MDINRVRKGLARAADVIPDLTCHGFVPSQITPPAFVAGEVSILFDQTFGRGMDDIEVTCRIFVASDADELRQDELGEYLSGSGDKSLKQALEAARGVPGEAALWGACDDFHVRRIQGYRFYKLGGIDYFGAEIVVRVIGDGE